MFICNTKIQIWEQCHYKLPLGPISKLDEHKITFFEVLLEGFNANKAKKFEKTKFFQHGEVKFSTPEIF